MRLTSEQIAVYVGGTIIVPSLDPHSQVTGLTWDSRAVAFGDLYVGLPGERVDGDDFAEAAIAIGAAAVMVSKDPDAGMRDAAHRTGAAIIRVADTAAAIADLAAAWRGCLTGTVLALTGSSGKTTTKNLIRDVLAARGSVVATEANQNNELGVPATLLRADEATDAVVVEMGMRGMGQLKSLCSFVKPDMALVTNVGESHIELLGSCDNIAKAKAEVFSALPDGSGCAFINSSEGYARTLRDIARLRERNVDIVWYDGSGCDPNDYDADMRPAVFARDIEIDGHGRPRFTLNISGTSTRCQMELRGAHNVHNACAAAAVGARFGMDVDTVARALEASQPMVGRAQVRHGFQGITVVDDAYNANPDSMRASLSMFASMDAPGQHIAVLGDMGELGGFASELHFSVGEDVADAGIDRLLCVGCLARGIARGAIARGMEGQAVEAVESVDAALDVLNDELKEGDAVLVKASHSMGFERIVKGLVG